MTEHVYYIYAARLLHGINVGAILLMVPVYINEIANDEIRGVLGSSVTLFLHFGLLLAFLFGNYCSYYFPSIFMIALTVLFAILFWFMPETPIFLVKQNKIFVCCAATGNKNNCLIYSFLYLRKQRNLSDSIEI